MERCENRPQLLVRGDDEFATHLLLLYLDETVANFRPRHREHIFLPLAGASAAASIVDLFK